MALTMKYTIFIIILTNIFLIKVKGQDTIMQTYEETPIDSMVEALQPKFIWAKIDPNVDPKVTEMMVRRLMNELGRSNVPLVLSRNIEIAEQKAAA